MNILALDLGTQTGWALSESGRIESGVQDFTPKRGDSPGMRFLRFNRWLDYVTCVPTSGNNPAIVTVADVMSDGSVQMRRVDLIVYERAHHRGGAATDVLVGMKTRVEECCTRYGIEHEGVPSATLKKFTTGSGRSDKAAMYRAARERGWLVGQWDDPDEGGLDDNQCDAICLLHYALAELAPLPRGGDG